MPAAVGQNKKTARELDDRGPSSRGLRSLVRINVRDNNVGDGDVFIADPNDLRLIELADKFEVSPYLAVATLKDVFRGDEKRVLRAAVEKGYRMIPLTRLELDPYDLHQRFATTRNRYAVSFRDLSEGSIAVNLG